MTFKNATFLHTIVMSFLIVTPYAYAEKSEINLPPTLTLPIDCTLGKDCYIQNYVDLDPSKATQDVTCGHATYNGHKGTDFAIITLRQMAQGVRVIASAPGRVLGLRNNMPDILIKTPQLKRTVKGRECGNGIVVQHNSGWQTQYCHLRKGSIKVRKGQLIKRGQMIGLVGLSGMTQFPHVHLSLRHTKKVVDPFLGLARQTCATTTKRVINTEKSLWHKDIRHQLPTKTTILYQAGFADHAVLRQELRLKPPQTPSSKSAPALLLYASIANIEKGDHLDFTITDPTGRIILQRSGKVLEKHKARYMQFSGKRRPKTGWPAGEYQGKIQLRRKGKIIIQRRLTMTLD